MPILSQQGNKDRAMLFAKIYQPDSDYVLIPRHSSENRRFIPMAFFNKNHIVSDSCTALLDASLYHFGVLQSTMHMAWTRQVCGRLEGRYRYSKNIVYNNFPWPAKPTPAQKEHVEVAAQKILNIRATFPESTLAGLYDPSSMPKAWVDTHRKLDAAVDACYRSKGFKTELERLEFLFELYEQYLTPLISSVEKRSNKGERKLK